MTERPASPPPLPVSRMPLYNYECTRCGPFVSFRLIDERDAPAACPECRRAARRVITAPNLALMPVATRKAHAVNERSRHAPRVSRGHRCGAGCGCGAGSRKKPAGAIAGKTPEGAPAFKASRRHARPWMLGH
ncbi:putative regulatory protein, FmdB family [Opitutaceae bacterium TAV1]|nr:putative regulatory protein, FmdB family [Opitutaceae bacterium TAV1]